MSKSVHKLCPCLWTFSHFSTVFLHLLAHQLSNELRQDLRDLENFKKISKMLAIDDKLCQKIARNQLQNILWQNQLYFSFVNLPTITIFWPRLQTFDRVPSFCRKVIELTRKSSFKFVSKMHLSTKITSLHQVQQLCSILHQY